MVSERRPHPGAPGPAVPLSLLLLVVAVVSMLGIFRGPRMRDVVEALARHYLKRE